MSIRVDAGSVKNRLREERTHAEVGDCGVRLMTQVGEIGVGGFMGVKHYRLWTCKRSFGIGARVSQRRRENQRGRLG